MVFPLTWFYTRIILLWWWHTGSLSIFDFFDRHHCFFDISFVPPSLGPVFDDAGFVAFTGLLRSLNLHLFPVSLFHKVQFGVEDLPFQGGTSDPSPLLDFNLHLFSSNLLFDLGLEAFTTPARCFSKVSSFSSMKAFGLKSHHWFSPLFSPLFARVLCAFSSVYHVSITYSPSLIVYHLYQLKHTTIQTYVCFVLVVRLFFRVFCFVRFFR